MDASHSTTTPSHRSIRASAARSPSNSRALRTRTEVQCPFTIIVDGREQTPFHFTGMKSDADKRNVPINISWQWGQLVTGDYSIAGMESRVCVERKSLSDLYSTIGQRREHFRTEHIRMSRMEAAAVVIEADLETAMNSPPQSKLWPKNVYRVWISWLIRYRVPWFFMKDVREAEIFTFRFLNRFYELDQERLAEQRKQERKQAQCDSQQPDTRTKMPLEPSPSQTVHPQAPATMQPPSNTPLSSQQQPSTPSSLPSFEW